MISLNDEMHRKRKSKADRLRKEERETGIELVAIAAKIINRHRDEIDISPAWVATASLNGELEAIPVRNDWPLVYKAAHLQFRQIARAILAKRFEPDGGVEPEAQDDLFPELQSRYPVHRQPGEEPVYRQREKLTRPDRVYNINRLSSEIGSKQKHLDAFRVWHNQRCEDEARSVA
jgi:hypothetical protein